MEITVVKASHVPGIVEVWKEFKDSYREIDPLFIRRDDGHLNFEKLVKRLIGSDSTQILVALDKDHVVGYAIFRMANYPLLYQIEKYGLIAEMTIKSAYQRKGIGGQMLKEIFNWFQSRGVSRIELRVAAKNQIGYSFWKKYGFEDYIHFLYLDK